LITIMAVGSRLLVMQYEPSNKERKKLEGTKLDYETSNIIRNVGMGITILGVIGVLTGFTIQNYLVAAITGFILFIGLVIVEVVMIYQVRSTMKLISISKV